jgi:stringent starvation protein B
VDDTVRVPRAFVVDGRIVLDISAEATNQLELGDEWITFQARFGTKVENLSIPVGNVMAIYAEETNQGMAFDAAPMQGDTDEKDDDGPIEPKQSTSEKPNSPSPLKVVK